MVLLHSLYLYSSDAISPVCVRLKTGYVKVNFKKMLKTYGRQTTFKLLGFDRHLNTKFPIKQKQPPRGVPRKRCSEIMQQIYRRTPMPKCDFNKVAKQLF